MILLIMILLIMYVWCMATIMDVFLALVLLRASPGGNSLRRSEPAHGAR